MNISYGYLRNNNNNKLLFYKESLKSETVLAYKKYYWRNKTKSVLNNQRLLK